jgi:uncharacterized protein
MTMNRVLRGRPLVSVAILGLSVLVSCGADSDPEPVPEPRTGLANPASVYCEDAGGTVEIVTDAEGNEAGICVLPDGTRVDEWEYYRDRNG